MRIALQDFQREFSRALISPKPNAQPQFLSRAAGRRFRIYRNNYFASLAKRLAEIFPAANAALGDKAFNGLVYHYAATHPPQARTLACFGKEFLEYLLEAEGPFPWLGDLARLEHACHEALHASDSEALDPKALTALGPAVSTARFVIHPAVRVIASAYPLLEIRKMVKKGEKNRISDLATKPVTVLVSRPGSSVLTTAITPGEATFLDGLIAGGSALAALEKAGPLNATLNAERAFGKFLTAGAFCGVFIP